MNLYIFRIEIVDVEKSYIVVEKWEEALRAAVNRVHSTIDPNRAVGAGKVTVEYVGEVKFFANSILKGWVNDIGEHNSI